MINKIKNIPFVTLVEIDKIEDITIEYLDNGTIYNRFHKILTYEIDDLNNIPDLVEKMFIDKIKELHNYVPVIEYVKEDKLLIKIQSFLGDFKESYDKKIKYFNENCENIFNEYSLKSNALKKKYETKEDLLRNVLDKNDIFFLVPHGFKIVGYDVIETKYLENEIIFGYKSRINDPGIVLCTNNDMLSDKNNLKMSLVDVGYYPERAYCLLNISNILK